MQAKTSKELSNGYKKFIAISAPVGDLNGMPDYKAILSYKKYLLDNPKEKVKNVHLRHLRDLSLEEIMQAFFTEVLLEEDLYKKKLSGQQILELEQSVNEKESSDENKKLHNIYNTKLKIALIDEFIFALLGSKEEYEKLSQLISVLLKIDDKELLYLTKNVAKLQECKKI